jgi:hypothetical protein
MRKHCIIIHSQVKQHTLAMNKINQKEDIIAKTKTLILTKTNSWEVSKHEKPLRY